MTNLYELPPEQQLALVAFARARLAEEKARRLREFEIKESVLDDAEADLRKQQDNPSPLRSVGWKSVGETWPAYMAYLVAAPYKDHADYKPEWNRD